MGEEEEEEEEDENEKERYKESTAVPTCTYADLTN